MFDTIAITKTFNSVPLDLLNRGWRPCVRPKKGFSQCWRLNGHKGSREPRITLSRSPEKLWHCDAELSPTAWDFGRNIKLADEALIETILPRLSAYVTAKLGVDFDATLANVRRVDFSFDVVLGAARVNSVLRCLRNLHIPRYNTHSINGETVKFLTKGKKSNLVYVVYDKFAEVQNTGGTDDELARVQGVVRVEASYKTTKATGRLQEKLKLSDRCPRTILTNEVASIVHINTIKKLGLAELLGKDEPRSAADILIERYGVHKGSSLIGFLYLVHRYGNSHYALKMSKRTFLDKQRACRDAGVWSLE